jgi:hypothetical protein
MRAATIQRSPESAKAEIFLLAAASRKSRRGSLKYS